MAPRPRIVLPIAVLAVLSLSGCSKKEPPRAEPAVSSRTVRSAAAPRAPVDPDTLTLQYDLGKVPLPTDNPQTDQKVLLGHKLFFDKRLSGDGSRSCYSCHQNEDGNGGHEPLAIGARRKQLKRHSPVIWNVGYAGRLYWDGRSGSLEEQGMAALTGGNMGVGKDTIGDKAKQIAAIRGYKQAFEAAFPDTGGTPKTIVQALSAYQRTLICDDTAYDRYAKGDRSALSAEQKRGLSAFTGKGFCATCHAPPFFSLAVSSPEGAYFNTGIGTQGKAEADVDVGRMAVSKKDADWAAFKVPSLRNVSNSAPYFHDGSVATLRDAVVFMAGGGAKNKNLSPLLRDRQLTAGEVDDIVAFLDALDCGKKLEAPALPK